jgi:hypothetical protein
MNLTTPEAVQSRLESLDDDLAIIQNVRKDKTGCWLWQKHITPTGYGEWWQERGTRLAHRRVYELVFGPIAPGFEMDHLCRVRACVNPLHLEVVTRHENARRGAKSKFNLDEIAEILTSPLGASALARRYGVKPQTIDYYKSGEYQRRMDRAA